MLAVVSLAVVLLAVSACPPSSSRTNAPANGSGSSAVPAPDASVAPVVAKPPAPPDAPVAPVVAKPPAAPADAASALPAPIDIKTALAALPEMKADPMIAPGTTPDGRQVHGTWCLRGTGADGVMRDLAASLTSAGWTNITTRGDATKAGVSAERDGYRASYVVSASTANACRAPGHYFASLTMFRMRD